MKVKVTVTFEVEVPLWTVTGPVRPGESLLEQAWDRMLSDPSFDADLSAAMRDGAFGVPVPVSGWPTDVRLDLCETSSAEKRIAMPEGAQVVACDDGTEGAARAVESPDGSWSCSWWIWTGDPKVHLLRYLGALTGRKYRMIDVSGGNGHEGGRAVPDVET